jgi:hypothetical protein
MKCGSYADFAPLIIEVAEKDCWRRPRLAMSLLATRMRDRIMTEVNEFAPRDAVQETSETK